MAFGVITAFDGLQKKKQKKKEGTLSTRTTIYKSVTRTCSCSFCNANASSLDREIGNEEGLRSWHGDTVEEGEGYELLVPCRSRSHVLFNPPSGEK
jgi:hypothetical protein